MQQVQSYKKYACVKAAKQCNDILPNRLSRCSNLNIAQSMNSTLPTISQSTVVPNMSPMIDVSINQSHSDSGPEPPSPSLSQQLDCISDPQNPGPSYLPLSV